MLHRWEMIYNSNNDVMRLNLFFSYKQITDGKNML